MALGKGGVPKVAEGPCPPGEGIIPYLNAASTRALDISAMLCSSHPRPRRSLERGRHYLDVWHRHDDDVFEVLDEADAMPPGDLQAMVLHTQAFATR